MQKFGDLDASATINDITTRYPQVITVFNDFGVEICCGGDITVSEAAERDGVDLQALTTALENAIASVSAAR